VGARSFSLNWNFKNVEYEKLQRFASHPDTSLLNKYSNLVASSGVTKFVIKLVLILSHFTCMFNEPAAYQKVFLTLIKSRRFFCRAEKKFKTPTTSTKS
jgi:hypothetical protein